MGYPAPMKGSPLVVKTLNELLAAELTAMDVYLVQSRVCADWGFEKIAAQLAHEFDDERGHANKLIERILFLEGTPQMGPRDAFEIGEDVTAMLKADLVLEHSVANNLNAAITAAVAEADNGTREMLVELLRDTEGDHILWLETQLRLIDRVGLQNYLQEQIS